jgi:hypothetical protein
MKKISVLLVLFLWGYSALMANEGMWLPHLLKKLNEPEMKSLGMRISAEDIYSINKGSIKDAVVHFAGGCTAEVISSQGLLLTNHHCGYSYIQRHSSPEKNYLEKGFWAKSLDEEIANQGLTVTFIVRIEDMTTAVLSGISSDLAGADRQSAIDKNINSIRESIQLNPHENMFIRPFYEGNEYYMFVTKTYRDVRLVGTPPDFVGKYGADTDNWVWPRHTGDFAIFRIYADADNNPADYSPNNQPYRSKYVMKINLNGVKENDFVFAFGFPGRTQQYLHSAAIDQVQNVLNPARVEIRERALAIIDAAMREDPVIKIQYASKQSRISNFWKKWKGESMGLARSNAVKERKEYEAEFNRRINNGDIGNIDKKSPLAADKLARYKTYKGLTDQFAKLYKEQNPYARAVEIYSECIQRNPEITRTASTINALVRILEESGAETFEQRKSRVQSSLLGMFKDYQKSIDQDVLAAMLDFYFNNMSSEYHPTLLKTIDQRYNGDWASASKYLFSNTILATESQLTELLNQDPESFKTAAEQDIIVQLVKQFTELANDKIFPKYNELNDQINALKRLYMQAQMDVFSEKTFSPDANSTLRVSYGKVSGYKARDAISFKPLTTIDGVMEKYIPGDYEFNLDERFRDLVAKKDYGPYAVNGTVPVNFIAALHTTGGNSGSPVLNADGHLVGLLFDGAWEGVMSDIYYSEDLVRSIMVDMRYVLFIIDKYAGAQNLLKEMEIIMPSASGTKEVKPSKGRKGKSRS